MLEVYPYLPLPHLSGCTFTNTATKRGKLLVQAVQHTVPLDVWPLSGLRSHHDGALWPLYHSSGEFPGHTLRYRLVPIIDGTIRRTHTPRGGALTTACTSSYFVYNRHWISLSADKPIYYCSLQLAAALKKIMISYVRQQRRPTFEKELS